MLIPVFLQWAHKLALLQANVRGMHSRLATLHCRCYIIRLTIHDCMCVPAESCTHQLGCLPRCPGGNAEPELHIPESVTYHLCYLWYHGFTGTLNFQVLLEYSLLLPEHLPLVRSIVRKVFMDNMLQLLTKSRGWEGVILSTWALQVIWALASV